MTRVVSVPTWIFGFMIGIIILNAVAWGLISIYGRVVIGE